MDLLTVRYFNLIECMTDGLLKANAGQGHSGLSVEELKDQRLVLETYRKQLAASAKAVLEAPMKEMAR